MRRVVLGALALAAIALLCWAYRRRVARVEPQIPFAPRRVYMSDGLWRED